MKDCPNCGFKCDDNCFQCENCGFEFRNTQKSYEDGQNGGQNYESQPYGNSGYSGGQDSAQNGGQNCEENSYTNSGYSGGQDSSNYTYQNGGYYNNQPPKNNTLAILSLIFGILGLVFLCCKGAGIIFSILAIVFGALSRDAINKSYGAQTGLGFSTAGLVLGIIGASMLVIGIIIAVIFGISIAAISSHLPYGLLFLF